MARRTTLDLFPAIIYLVPPSTEPLDSPLMFFGPKPQGTRKVDRCRVAISGGLLFIVVDSPEGPKVVFRERAIEHEKSADHTHHVTTETGKLAVFGKDANCGCGSRLRSWSPFGSISRSSADPTE